MRPILFKIGNLNIYGYGVMIAIGIICAVFLLSKRANQRHYNIDSVSNMAIIAIICGILGGKILFLLTEIKNIPSDPSILKDIKEGFVIYGAILGGALGVYFYSRKKSWNVLDVFDLVIPTVALAQGFGRIGCFLAGCCYGRPTNSIWGIKFKNSLFAPSDVYLIPTQLYSSLFDFLLCAFLLWYDKKNNKEGKVLGMYFLLYGIGRFLIEFLRNDPRGSIGILSTSQFISIFVIAFAIFILNINKFKKVKNEK